MRLRVLLGALLMVVAIPVGIYSYGVVRDGARELGRLSHPPKAQVKHRSDAARRRLVRAPAMSARVATSDQTTEAWIFGGLAFGLLFAFVVVPGTLVAMRLRARRKRVYRYYEIVHSMHDEARKKDVEDAIETLAHLVRETPMNALRYGQGHVSWVVAKFLSEGREDFKIFLEIEPRHAEAADAILASAWPDVRLGHGHAGKPESFASHLLAPGYLLRYRKEREFIYTLSTEDDQESRPPLEAVARMMSAIPEYAIVRLQLTPMSGALEDWARRRAHRAQNRVERASVWGLREAGMKDRVNAEAFQETARRVTSRGLFSLEAQVAAPDRTSALRVGAALSAARGDNRLKRRVMTLRTDLYKRRFTRAQGPLFPTLSGRSLVSTAEVAHIVELPSARMKNVPLRRLPLPRIPAPPEIVRCERRGPMDDPPSTPAAPGPASASVKGADGANGTARLPDAGQAEGPPERAVPDSDEVGS